MASKFKLSEIVARLRIVSDRKANAEAENEVKQGFARLEGLAKKVGGAIAAAFAIEKILSFGKSLIKTAADAEIPWNRLANTVENAGVSFEAVERRIKLAARAMQDTTRVGDEEFATVLDRLISLTGDFEGSLRNVPLVADVAAQFFHGELAPAADLVGRAMAGNTRQLRQLGIAATDANEALRILAERSRGAAENEAKTLSGRLGQISNELSDLAEAGGNFILTLLGLATGSDNASGYLDGFRRGIKALTFEVEKLTQRARAIPETLKGMIALGRGSVVEAQMHFAKASVLVAEADAAVQRMQEEAEKNIRNGLRRPGEETDESIDEEISQIARLHRLEKLRSEDILRALDLYERFDEQLRKGNLTRAERLRLEERLATLKPITTVGVQIGEPRVFDPIAPIRTIRVPKMDNVHPILNPNEPTVAELLAEDWLKNNETIVAGAHEAANGIEDAFKRAFENVAVEGEGLAGGLKGLFGGLGETALGFLQGWARGKVKFNVGEALEKTAMGIAAEIINPPAAGVFFRSAAMHALAATGWAALAGGIGAVGTAVSGGSSRGGGGAFVSGGSVDADARRFDFERKPQINIYVDGFDPRNPVHVQLLGEGIREVGRTDSAVNVFPRSRAA